MSRDEPGAILVRAPNWLGDCVMSLPALSALRRAHPQARISVSARPSVAPVFRWTPDVDEVDRCPAGGGLRNLAAKNRHSARLRARGFDAGLLLTHSLSTAFWMWRARVPRRVGTVRRGRRALVTDPVALDPRAVDLHQSEAYLAIAARLGADPRPTLPRLARPAPAPGAVRAGPPLPPELAAGQRDYVVLGPGSAYGPAKNWLPERYAALAERILTDTDAAVVLTGTARDQDLAASIARTVGREDVVDLAGRTDLTAFLEVLADARGFVGNDSGASHCAAALGLPTVVVFGSTRPGRTRPLGERVACLEGFSPCAPCLKRRCPNRRRPMACMEAVTVRMVWDAIIDLGVFAQGSRGRKWTGAPAGGRP